MLGNSTLRTMRAVGDRTLPIRPGDMLTFRAKGWRVLIIASSEQENKDGMAGQRVCGIVSTTDAYWWHQFWLDWTGLNVAWTIDRS